MPGLRAGPSWRVVSPSGGSILITSAPRSPSCWAAHGPSTTVVQSRILTPSNGPAIDATSPVLSPRLPQVGHACALNMTGSFLIVAAAMQKRFPQTLRRRRRQGCSAANWGASWAARAGGRPRGPAPPAYPAYGAPVGSLSLGVTCRCARPRSRIGHQATAFVPASDPQTPPCRHNPTRIPLRWDDKQLSSRVVTGG